MGGVSGNEIKAAFKKASTWGTAVACGANNGILLRPTSIKKSAEVMIDDSLGNFFSKDGSLGAIKVEGDLPAYLRYDGGVVDLLAFVMGFAAAPVQQGATAAYNYTFTQPNLVDGIFATFAMNMKNYVREVPSLKVAGFTIKGEAGKPLEITFHCIGDNFIIDSAVNTLTTFNDVTYFETANRIRFSEGVFRINDQADIALADAHKVYPSSFELKFMRPMEGRHTGQYTVTAGSSKQEVIDEPQASGMPEVTLNLTFPRHTSTTWLAALGNDARKKADITFTGGLIESTYYRSMKFWFPNLQLSSNDVTDEQGIIQEPLTFISHGCVTAPTGMTGVTTPLRVSGTNRKTTSPLA